MTDQLPPPAPPPREPLKASHKVMLGVAVLLVLLKLIETFVHVPFNTPGQQALFGWKSALFFIALLLLGSGFVHVIGFPGMWEKTVTNRQRIWIPLLVGLAFGGALLVADRASNFSRVYAAILGESGRATPFGYLLLVQAYNIVCGAILFTLFAVSFSVWFIGVLLLSRHWPSAVFWTVAALICLWEPYSLGAAHHWALLHSVQVSAGLVALFALLYALDLLCAMLLRRYGFTAALILRVSAVAVWHIIGKS